MVGKLIDENIQEFCFDREFTEAVKKANYFDVDDVSNKELLLLRLSKSNYVSKDFENLFRDRSNINLVTQ